MDFTGEQEEMMGRLYKFNKLNDINIVPPNDIPFSQWYMGWTDKEFEAHIEKLKRRTPEEVKREDERALNALLKITDDLYKRGGVLYCDED